MDSTANKKIQFMSICTSVSLGGKSLYAKRDEEENSKIKKDDSVWKKVGSDYDNFLIDKTFNSEDFPNYTRKGAVNIQSNDYNLSTKMKFMDEVKAFFNNNDFDASLLVISGYGGQVLNMGIKESYFVIITTKGDEHVSYTEIANLWLSRTSKEKNKNLLIVIDVPNSGCWVSECKEHYHYDTIAIQASSGEDELAHNIKNQGGILIHNFLELNSKEDKSKEIHISKLQKPCAVGIYHEIKSIYGLELLFNSWEEFKKLESVNKDFIGDKYFGVLVDRKKVGPGVMKYQNGDHYQGEWANDRKNGFGSMLYATKDKYIGYWKDDQFNGKGAYFYTNDNRYEGEYVDGHKSGNGIYYFANGNRYDGNFKDDKNEGHGILYYKSGNKYIGMFSNGKKNGKGVYTYSDGGKYEGELKNDKFSGNGIFFFNNGNKYEGGFLEGKKFGKGVFEYKSGNKYDGEWKDDKFSGYGLFFFKTGDRYEGEFKDGVFSGKGTYIYKNTDRYEGEWKLDQKNGKGIFHYKNGDKFEGIFKNGKRNGEGVILQKMEKKREDYGKKMNI